PTETARPRAPNAGHDQYPAGDELLGPVPKGEVGRGEITGNREQRAGIEPTHAPRTLRGGDGRHAATAYRFLHISATGPGQELARRPRGPATGRAGGPRGIRRWPRRVRTSAP